MSKSALAITEEHTDLADSAIGQLNRLNSRAAARATLENGSAHPSEIWSAGKDLGWNGLAIAEEHGGSGFGLAELAVVLEAQGRELSPGPFLPTVAAAVVIDRCAPDSVSAQHFRDWPTAVRSLRSPCRATSRSVRTWSSPAKAPPCSGRRTPMCW